MPQVEVRVGNLFEVEHGLVVHADDDGDGAQDHQNVNGAKAGKNLAKSGFG